ncbi:L,D-transpeptidase family protein [Limisphaera sp. 4302-co]|uniref:L,D-transpeptidase family protein n=1 Tax=Limisphaera sp. 4302-co TaxID=3400417 RepID=UPI003C1769D8
MAIACGVGLLVLAVAVGRWFPRSWWPEIGQSQPDRKLKVRPGREAVSTPGARSTRPLVPEPRADSRGQPPAAAPVSASPGLRGGRTEPGRAAGEATYPRPAADLLEVQVALARRVLSPGSLDGAWGPSTSRALEAFQEEAGLPVTGAWDESTRPFLLVERPALKVYTVTEADRQGLQPLHRSWWGKSVQEALEHETLLERLAERHHVSPRLLQRLNPGLDWDDLPPGQTIRVPDAEYPPPRARAARLQIRLGARWLRAYDEDGRLLAHFPCSVARNVEKRPVGRLHVSVVVERPNYTFNPEIFPDAPESQEPGRKLILPPGPNNPVGLAWIGLDRPGYGIHGTPWPERVGRPESRGCFRLTNWDALYLLRLVRVGTPVDVEP